MILTIFAIETPGPQGSGVLLWEGRACKQGAVALNTTVCRASMGRHNALGWLRI
ncbi:hypothetical protein [Pseudooceanicola algae]|uniref:hypothetical protein n=1 Tax=Pseudooceanicola algae TaxID=1537215 RepID=UPI0018AD13A0|nr:hypothetical protein [Pseudooceanicola algae]